VGSDSIGLGDIRMAVLGAPQAFAGCAPRAAK